MGSKNNCSQSVQANTSQVLIEFDIEKLFRSFDQEKKSEGFTSEELIEHLGKSRKWVMERLRKLVSAGQCKVVRVLEPDITGRNNQKYRYIFTEEKESE